MRLLPKLVVFMTVVAAVPLALAGWRAIQISESVTREQIGDAHQRLAENLGESIKSFDAEELQALASAARAFDFEHLSPPERQGALRLLFLQMPSADLLALVDGNGNDIVAPVAVAPEEPATGPLAHRATRNENQVAAFRTALNPKSALAESAWTSDLYDVSGTRGPHQAIAVLAGSNGWLLAAEISFEKVRSQLEMFHLGDHGTAFLVDETGRILIHRDPKRVGEDLSKQPLIAGRLADVAHGTAAGELVDAHGDLSLAAWAPIGRWGLVVSQPAGDALRASSRLRGQSVLWVFTALLFAVVLAVFYAREVSKPVLTVADGARKLASGDLAHRLNFSSHDEIGEMARAFDDMASKLQSSMSEIARQNDEIRAWNATLMEKVEERTKALREAQAELVQTKKHAALAELGAGLAHELNNPLAAIKGFAQLLLLTKKPEDKDFKQLKTIEEQSKRCSEIVIKLLRYSEQAGNSKKERVDLNDALEEALKVVEQRLVDEKVEVERSFGFGLPPVMASPGELREVLWHLLSNARNAMPQGGKLSISTWREVANGNDLVRVCVKDNGRGIDPAIVDRIFEPFFTTKDEWRGTGLGLAVVHRIVVDHGGTIAVESKPKEGASFTITFPAAGAAAPMDLEAPGPPRPMRVKTQLV